MNPQQLQQVQVAAPLIAAGLFILALLLLLLSVYYFRRSRTDFYWRSRRRAGQFGWRIFVVALSLTLVSGIICVIIGVGGMLTGRLGRVPTSLPNTTTAVAQNETLAETPTVTSTKTSTEIATDLPTEEIAQPTVESISVTTEVVLHTETAALTETSTPSRRTATRKPTATQPPTATSTITPTPSETFILSAPAMILTLESSVTPNPDAKLDITALDTQLSADFKPVNPNDSFDAGFKRIYYFVTFRQMGSGVIWRRQLLHDGKTLDDMDYIWGLEPEGTTFFFFGHNEGFQPGQYEIRLFIGQANSPAATAQFTVK